MRILVTGGAGFIGSHLVEHHLSRGDDVVVLDDFSTGRRVVLDRLSDRLARGDLGGAAGLAGPNGSVGSAGGTPQLRVLEGSVCDGPLVENAVAGCDLVYHMAAAVGVQWLQERPLHALGTNGVGVGNVLSACAGHGAAFVLASSSEVYGDAPDAPFREDQPLRIEDTKTLRSGYAGAKAQAECTAFTYASELGLRVLVVRLFNTVGPGQRARYGMVLPRFIDQALAGEPLTIFGDGSQSRCFAHVDDVVSAIVGLVDGDAFGDVFNIGSDIETSIEALAHEVLDVVGSGASKGALEYVPFEVANPGFGIDVHRRVPALDKLRTTLGRALPTRPLRSILEDVARVRSARVPSTPS